MNSELCATEVNRYAFMPTLNMNLEEMFNLCNCGNVYATLPPTCESVTYRSLPAAKIRRAVDYTWEN